MIRIVLLASLALGVLVAAAPTALASDAACVGQPASVAVCEEHRAGWQCFSFWVLGDEQEELGFCM